MSAVAMRQALAALNEVLLEAGADLRGINIEHRGAMLWADGNSFCDDEIDAEDRVKLAIKSLTAALHQEVAA